MTDKRSIEDFLSQYNNQGTLNLYRSTLRDYFKLFYPELQKLSRKKRDKEVADVSLQYINQDKDFRNDLMRYRKHINNLAPKTITTKFPELLKRIRCVNYF